MLAGDFPRNSAARAPDRVALIGRGQRLTYAQFDEQANRLANALLDLGLRKGAKVAILSTNRPEYAIAYFGIARTPYVSVHCSTRSTADELLYVLNKTEAELLFLENRFVPLIEAVLSELDKPTKLIVFGRPQDQTAELADDMYFDQMLRDKSAAPPDVSLDENDPLAITLTGGTTGLPKAVLVSHRSRCASAIAAAVARSVLLAATTTHGAPPMSRWAMPWSPGPIPLDASITNSTPSPSSSEP